MVPFVVLLVTLDEGVRLLGYLVDDAGRVCQTDGSAEGVRDRPARALAVPRPGGHAAPVLDARVS